MNPLQLLFILKAQYKIALAVASLTVVGALVATQLLTKQYTATTSVLVDVRSPDPVATALMPASLATQVDIIGSERVARKVVKTLGLADNEAQREMWMSETGGKGSQEGWIAERLQRGLKITPARDSNIVTIAYTGTDPKFAAAVANSFAQSYIETSVELKVEPARQYAQWFAEQGKALRDNLESTQTQVSAYQQKKGIVASTEQLDTETLKLSELTTQLIKVQAETSDARSKQRSGSSGSTPPEVTANPVVAGLRSEIAKLEAKLQETAINLGKNHPQYLRMQSEVAALKQRLESETKLVTSGFGISRTIGADKEAELVAAIAEQKRKLLKLKNERDQVAVLQRDVDTAKNAYDSVSKRYAETTLASQATQANVSVLSPATVPLVPSFPKSLDMMLGIAVVLSLVLGVGAAFGYEMLDRRIRSVYDLAEALQVPVLGVITQARQPEPRRLLPFLRRNTPLLVK
jgi:succinoglycan biosynthesis transport protein ExoP